MNKMHPVLLYSQFALGKSAFLASFVDEMLPLLPEGSKARLVTAEHYVEYLDLQTEGRIEIWKINTRDHPFSTAQRACDGWWPENPLDPESPLLPPSAETWSRYPIRIFEGTATIANYLAGNSVKGAIAQRIGSGESIGPTDSGELIRIQDGETVVGGLSRSNYGFVQKEMISLIQRSQKHAGFVIWTGQEDDAKEKKGGVSTGNTILGPEVFGAALTSTIGREFADVWRIVAVPADYENGADSRRILERRLYLKEHLDPFGASFVAKGRNSAGRKRQFEVPDYIRLTDPERPGAPREDAAKRVIETLHLLNGV